MRSRLALLAALTALLGTVSAAVAMPMPLDAPAAATQAAPAISLQLRASGLTKPLFVTSARDGTAGSSSSSRPGGSGSIGTAPSSRRRSCRSRDR